MVFESYLKTFLEVFCSRAVSHSQIISREGLKSLAVMLILLAE